MRFALFVFWLSFLVSPLLAQDPLRIEGTVRDETTGSGLPFATVHVEGTSIGTSTNLQGEFQFLLPSHLENDTLLVSCMGFESSKRPIREASKRRVDISLISSIIELESVTVRPVSAKEYIRRAISKLDENYPNEFGAYAYFRQHGYDAGRLLQLSEGYIQAHVGNFLHDTAKVQQRVLLYESQDQREDLNFRKKKREKKIAKARRRARKRGIEFDEDSVRNRASVIAMELITPGMLLDKDPIRQHESFLDSAQFKDFHYQFENDRSYQGRKVSVISFTSKKKTGVSVSNVKGMQEGVIYLDKDNDAIAGIDQRTRLIIPALVKPILFLAGYKASDPILATKIRYLNLHDRWYPQSIRFDLTMELTKKYWFKKNETSDLAVEILMSIRDINGKEIDRIPKKFLFDASKKIEDQVYPMPGLGWDTINRISLEEIK